MLLAHETDALIAELGERLARFAAESPTRWRSTITAEAKVLPTRQLEDGLRDSVERCVHEGFEAFRAEESERVEAAWRALAERFRARTQKRANAVRATAGALFTIDLPSLVVPRSPRNASGSSTCSCTLGRRPKGCRDVSRSLSLLSPDHRSANSRKSASCAGPSCANKRASNIRLLSAPNRCTVVVDGR